MCFPKGRYQASVTKRRSQLQPTLTTSSTKKTQVKKLLIACKRVGDEGRDGGHARGGERLIDGRGGCYSSRSLSAVLSRSGPLSGIRALRG